MADALNPFGRYMLLPDGMETPIEVSGSDVFTWLREGRPASYWPKGDTPPKD